jgi:hypothetical protein
MVEPMRKGGAEMARLMLNAQDNFIELVKKEPEAFSEHLSGLYQAEQAERAEHATALMDMIYWCAKLGWQLPQWAAEAFISASDKVRFGHIGSWDKALGRPYPKGTNLDRVRRHRNSFAIYHRVRELVDGEGARIDNDLFERVGAEFCLARTQCAKLYYGFKHREDKLLAAGISHFPKNPKTPGIT